MPRYYTDRMTLNKVDFEKAIHQEIKSVIYGLISKGTAKRYKIQLVTNIHNQALKDNKHYDIILRTAMSDYKVHHAVTYYEITGRERH